jgi:hypothetical protein
MTTTNDFAELAQSGERATVLESCFAAKLSAVAREEYGNNERAASVLGVHTITLSRWNTAGRGLPCSSLTPEVHGACARLARALYNGPAHNQQADAIFSAFREGFARAALMQSGSQMKAAVRCHLHPKTFGFWMRSLKRGAQSQS